MEDDRSDKAGQLTAVRRPRRRRRSRAARLMAEVTVDARRQSLFDEGEPGDRLYVVTRAAR